MAQSTNASAYRQLKPLENTNTGAIVEEHIRYWKKYKDEEEANKLEMEAKKRLYESQISEKYDKNISGLTGTDNLGYFQDSMVGAIEYQSSEIAKLAKDKTDGVPGATLKYDAKAREFKSASSLAEALSTKLKEDNAKIQSGDYNKVLDQPHIDITNALNSGQYIVDKKTLKLRVYSQDGKKILFDGSSEQLKNEYLSSGFNKKVDFITTGAEIAKGFELPEKDGNIQWNKNSRRLAILSSAAKLDGDPNLMETYKRIKGIYKPTGEMSPIEKNVLYTQFTDEFVIGRVKTTDNSLANANTRSAINARNVAQANTERELKIKESKLPTLKVATVKGQAVKGKQTSQSKGQPVSSKTSSDVWTSFTIGDLGVTHTEVVGNKTTATTLSALEISEKGDVKMSAKQTVKEEILDIDGTKTGKFKEVTIDKPIKSETEQNVMARKIYSPKLERNYNDLTEMVNDAIEIQQAPLPVSVTPPKAFDAEAFYKNRKSQK